MRTLGDDIHDAEIYRSLDLVAKAWADSGDNLSADDMIEHLDHLILVTEGKESFNDLHKSTGLNKNHLTN